MQIIFDPQIIKQLENKYTLLPLEIIPVEDQQLAAWCLIPAESLLNDLGTLELDKQVHVQLLAAVRDDQPQLAQGLCEMLLGKFGGELDTFYQVILERIETTGSTRLVLPPQV